MHLSDFNYELPPELIATEPARPRDASRMLALDRQSGNFRDSMFSEFPEFLRPSDVLVLNDTRVIRARIHGMLQRPAGTTREVELLFAGPVGDGAWEVMCKPGKSVRTGDRIVLANGKQTGTFGGLRDHGLRLLLLDSAARVEEFLERHGQIPLPPYIERCDTAADNVDYQTVYSASAGAVAAPTAGLHFTKSMLMRIQDMGIEVLKITLHVGIGTFLPIRTDDPEQHVLRAERFWISASTADRLNRARATNRRIVAVGTTTTRTLEHVFTSQGRFEATQGEAGIYILPGYKFKAIDGLLTNFHLPKSTLLMLVSAFAGRENVLNAYCHAVENRYRFYSYGDCMFVY
jgi:S-adenosylmethionine:tRNA ribosyltransferase-isomerase